MVTKVEKPEDLTHCTIHENYDVVAQELHAEMQKEGLDERSFEKILYLIKTAAKLQARLAGKTEIKLSQELVDEILLGTKKVAGYMHSIIPIATTVITGAIQLAAGATGIYGAAQGLSVCYAASLTATSKELNRLLEPSKQMGNLSQAIGLGASAVSNVKEVAKTRDESKRTIEQYFVDEKKRLRDEHNRDAGRKQDTLQELHRSIEQSNSAAHDTFSKMCH